MSTDSGETAAHMHGFDLRWISFGSPSAIVTSMALIAGLDAATSAKTTVLASLLIIGLADNLTDSLSVHIYQESERLAGARAFRTTVANFVARFTVSLSFIALFLALPTGTAVAVCLVWGVFLLSLLSYLLAKEREVSAVLEIVKHVGVATAVIAMSGAIGYVVRAVMG
jgi:VIT1/CCC1 family predicted Fe2+/Mn2+ transporter